MADTIQSLNLRGPGGRKSEEDETIRSLGRGASARHLAGGLPLLGFLLLVAACAGFNNPDGWAPPEETEDTLYLSLDGGKITAVDAESLTVRWEFPSSNEEICGNEEPQKRDLRGIYAAPIVADGSAFIAAWDGNVYALDEATGDCLWDFETNDPIIGGLAMDNGRLYTASTDGNLYVIDPATGEEIDRAHGGDAWSQPAVVDGVIYVSSVEGDLRAFDAETLVELWDGPFSVGAGLLTDPVVSNGTIIVGGIGEKLYAVDAATGTEKWSFGGATNWFWGRPLVDGGTVYATNLDSRVLAIDVNTGDRLWQFDGEAPIRAGVVITGGVVVAVDENGNVYGIDPQSGEAVWNGPTVIDKRVLADPYVLTGGDVMIVSTGGDVFMVSPEDGRLTTVRIGR